MRLKILQKKLLGQTRDKNVLTINGRLSAGSRYFHFLANPVPDSCLDGAFGLVTNELGLE